VPNAKVKADDYLLELATTSDQQWLRSLVSSVVAGRGTPKAAVLDRAFDALLVEHALKEPPVASSETATLQSTPPGTRIGFVFDRLKHEGGVNALAKGATIPFHSKLTVIYGKNGSGKSGFVRILKRLAGSKTQEEIWQDVRAAKSTNRCKATITYFDNGKETTCSWNGENGVAPFLGMGIFDGKCVPVYLTKNLTFSYQPYGFELFQALSDSLKGLQERLAASIRKVQDDKPFIGFCDAETSVGKFLASITAKTSVADIDKVDAWDEEAERNLGKLVKERSGLSNLDDQTELQQSRLGKLEAIETVLTTVQADLSEQTLKAYAGLARKLAALKTRKVIKKGKTLEDYAIPSMESDEWQQFIDAGEEYIALAKDESYPADGEACIYCQQKLSTTAIRLLRLYRELFKAEETTALDDLEQTIEVATEELGGVSYRQMFPYTEGDLDKVLPASTLAKLFALLAAADTLSKQATALLRGKSTATLTPLKLNDLPGIISKAKTKIRTEIRSLEDTRKNLFKKARELDRQIAEFQDLQKLRRGRVHVDKFLGCEHWVAKASRLTPRLNTKSVTDLGKVAWNELVSDAFQTTFRSESIGMDAPAVKLGFRGEYGLQVREKSVEGLTQIDQLLSEGEQKSVALADFFAEQSLQAVKMPVVFDDPATSFDHERKERIAARIVRESESRQVIVFTHDLMFASYLFDRVQNNNDIDASKAAFHDVRTEAATSGLLTDNYYLGSIKFDAAIKKVEDRTVKLATLRGEDRTEGIRTAYSLLRQAVEKAVEERIFGRVISRWSDQIQLHNVSKASLDRTKLDEAKKLHELFSRYIEAHNQSNTMIQHAIPDLDVLKAHIADVRKIALRQ
jgi:energy-coupling factor transporter ATP-binding protein EcfA2